VRRDLEPSAIFTAYRNGLLEPDCAVGRGAVRFCASDAFQDEGGFLRILIVGATGLIGSTLAARLAAEGYEIAGVARRPTPTFHPMTWASIDVAQATDPGAWAPCLNDVDAVVNCAGTLQDTPSDSTEGVHVLGIAALYEACSRAGVRRVIHFSAIGAERSATAFSSSKLRGEQELQARDLQWTVLRPSVVIGRSAYGGSALIRGLAALPVLPVMPDTAEIQPIHLDDVVETVVKLLRPDAPSCQVLELVGPNRCGFDDLVGMFRRWLRRPAAYSLRLPQWAAGALYRAGDAAAALGWKPPIRTTAQSEMRFGATGDASAWQRAMSIAARPIEQELAREPASVQERWFARMYLLKPLIFGVFGAFWIVTGLISLGPGWEIGAGYVREGGLGPTMAAAATVAGALADIVIGAAILYRPTARYGLYAAFLISIAYAVIGTILVPRLWIDPLGPMLKIWPIIVLNLAALAILDDR